MATASPHPSRQSATAPASGPSVGPIRYTLQAIYRFLASLKLAVVSLLSLALVLAYGTFFESWYGTSAVQEWVYRSPWFALVLLMLGTNVFCAAAIRFPWKARQTGFVITHTGLLIVLGGSLFSALFSDEGQVALAEGEEASVSLIKPDDATLKVRTLDPRTGRADREYVLPFRPGSFAWRDYQYQFLGVSAGSWMLGVLTVLGAAGVVVWCTPAARSTKVLTTAAGGVAGLVVLGSVLVLSRPGRPPVVLTQPTDPFRLEVKDFLPASRALYVHEPVEGNGVPMIEIAAAFKPPGATRAMDPFGRDPSGRSRWLVADNQFSRAARSLGPARFVFQYADTPEAVDDFLHPPQDPTTQKLARLHYRDNQGKPRVYEWLVDEGQVGKSVTLPDSDLTATLSKLDEYPDRDGRLRGVTGEGSFPVIQLQIRKGNGPELDHIGFSTLPMMASFLSHEEHAGFGKINELAQVGYFTPPIPRGSSTFGVIEVLGTPDGKLYARVFGRDGLRVPPGPIEPGKEVRAFGGQNMPMTLDFRVARYLTSARERLDFVPLPLPPNQKDQGIRAALVAMTVDGKAKEFWVRRTGDFEPDFTRGGLGPVAFSDDKVFQLAYDVEREPMGFRIRLDDFDATADPGSNEPSRFVSKIHLNDEARGIEDQPVTISMNNPMSHRGWTFYQSNFSEVEDPETGRKTGQFLSVFQVHHDPAWPIIYGGCYLVVFGALVQFLTRPLTSLYRRLTARAAGPQAAAEAPRAPRRAGAKRRAAGEPDFDPL